MELHLGVLGVFYYTTTVVLQSIILIVVLMMAPSRLCNVERRSDMLPGLHKDGDTACEAFITLALFRRAIEKAIRHGFGRVVRVRTVHAPMIAE